MTPEDFDNPDDDFELEMERLAAGCDFEEEEEHDDGHDTNLDLTPLYGNFPSEVEQDV